jgi:hypothetical protein
VLLQKRVVKIINKAVYDAHTEPMFNDLGLLPFQKIYLFHLGKFMFLFHKRMPPANFDNFFVVLIKFIIITRNSKLYYVPFGVTNIKQFSVIYQGVKFSNSISQNIYDAPSVSCFKKKLKVYLLDM